MVGFLVMVTTRAVQKVKKVAFQRKTAADNVLLEQDLPESLLFARRESIELTMNMSFESRYRELQNTS